MASLLLVDSSTAHVKIRQTVMWGLSASVWTSKVLQDTTELDQPYLISLQQISVFVVTRRLQGRTGCKEATRHCSGSHHCGTDSTRKKERRLHKMCAGLIDTLADGGSELRNFVPNIKNSVRPLRRSEAESQRQARRELWEALFTKISSSRLRRQAYRSKLAGQVAAL